MAGAVASRSAHARGGALPRGRAEARARPGPSALPPTRLRLLACGAMRHPRRFLFTIQTAQSSSFPRRVAAPGFCFPLSIRPRSRGGGAPTGAQFRLSRCQARRPRLSEARRASSGTRSPLGPSPWRFWVGGRASISGIASGSVQRCSSRPGRSAWRAGSRTSRGHRLRAAAAGRHSPLRLRHVSGDALDERGFGLGITDTYSSQYRSLFVVERRGRPRMRASPLRFPASAPTSACFGIFGGAAARVIRVGRARPLAARPAADRLRWNSPPRALLWRTRVERGRPTRFCQTPVVGHAR